MALLQVTHESTPAFGEVAALVDGAKTAVENARTIERVFPKFDCNEHPPDFECSYVAAAAICGDTPNWAIFNAFLCLSNSDPDFATPLPWPNYDNGGILNWAYIFCVSELVDDELVWGTIPAEMDQFLSLLQTLYTRDAEKLATAVNFTDRWGNSLGQAVAYEVTRGLPSLIVKYGANLLQSAGDGSLGDRMLSSARSSLQELQMRKPAIPENILKLAEVEVYKLFDSFRSQHILSIGAWRPRLHNAYLPKYKRALRTLVLITRSRQNGSKNVQDVSSHPQAVLEILPEELLQYTFGWVTCPPVPVEWW